MFYKNISYFVKTFHGVTFNPGETKEVADFINHPKMLRVEKPAEVKTNIPQKKLSSDNSKEELPKEEVEVAVVEVEDPAVAEQLADASKPGPKKKPTPRNTESQKSNN